MPIQPYGNGIGAGSFQPSVQGKKPAERTSGANIAILAAAAAVFGALYHLGGDSSRYTWPLTIASVYAHEMGHLIVSLLLGSSVSELNLSLMSDITLGAEGFVRHTIQDSRLANAAISAAGALSQVFTGMAFVLAAKRQTASRIVLGLSLAVCLFSLWYAGNAVTYGVIIALIAIISLALKFLKGGLLKLFMAFSGIAMATAMLENWRYLFMKDGSDMAHVSKYLFLPVWFWGGLVLLIGIAMMVLGIWTFIRTEDSGNSNSQSNNSNNNFQLPLH